MSLYAFIKQLFKKTKFVKDFPCDNWAGLCRKHCGTCVDRNDAWQNWSYKPEALPMNSAKSTGPTQ